MDNADERDAAVDDVENDKVAGPSSISSEGSSWSSVSSIDVETMLKLCNEVRIALVGLISDLVIDEEDPLILNVREDIRKLNVEAKSGVEGEINFVSAGKMV